MAGSGALLGSGGRPGKVAEASAPLAYGWDGGILSHAPELAAVGALRSCSVGRDHYAVATTGGGSKVYCAGGNHRAQLGVGDKYPREGLVATEPPLLGVSEVCFGWDFAVALHSDGRVSSWGGNHEGQLGRTGDAARPATVPGVPPVATLDAGYDFVIALTAAGEAYGWGRNAACELALCRRSALEAPQRIAALSGRGVRRLACATSCAVAETDAGELLFWGHDGGAAQLRPSALPTAPGLAFPLRGLAMRGATIVAAGANGALWCYGSAQPREPPRRLDLAGVVKVAAGSAVVVALTEGGELFDCSDPSRCRNLSAELPELPQGLVPYGGIPAHRVLLLPDHCGGKRRLSLFARIAARIGLPSDPIRAVLVGFAVHKVFLTGSLEDPFGSSAVHCTH